MKRYPKLLETIVVLLGIILTTNGCMTQGLWKDRVYHPAAKPDITVLAAPERPLILVGYREQFEKTDHIRWRAYWIDLTLPYDAHTKKNFVDPANFPGLIRVPLLTVTQNTNDLPTVGYAAQETLDKPGFDLWKDGQSVGRFALPSYEGDAPATVGTVAQTPVMLLLDGAIIILGAAAIAALGYLIATEGGE